MYINLPHDNNRTFHISSLIRHLINSQRDYIIQAQQHVVFEDHTKKSSLDYWIRENIAEHRNMAQATNQVIAQICATGLFEEVNGLICPDSGNHCGGIRLVDLNNQQA
jgi:hypothetical protein